MKDVYEEYRQRLLDKEVPVINSEIFETFAGKDFISNSLDLLEILLENDTKNIIEELEEIKKEIFNDPSVRDTDMEKSGYYLIAEGYLLRLKFIIQEKEKKV